MLRVKSAVMFFMLITSLASAQVSTGSIVALDLTPSELVVAADSREEFGGRSYDTACKIHVLDQRLIYVC